MILDVDVGALAPPGLIAQLDESAAHKLLEDIAAMARAKWISLANERLHRTSQDYVRAIQPIEVGDYVVSVTLMGRWPNMLETGFPPFDMRDSLLGPNVPIVQPGQTGRGKRQNKDGGYYRSIFLRMMSPTATGRNAQKVTDVYARQLGADRARELGMKAWKAMKQLDPSLSNPGERTKWGERLSTMGTDLAVWGKSHRLDKNPDGSTTFVPFGGREHHSPLFEGAVKMQQTYARASQALYGTFRTISTSSPDGWIHPGFAGARIAPDVVEYVKRIGPGMVEAFVQRATQPWKA